MVKVQADIDSVNAGAVVDKFKLISGIDTNEICDILQNGYQLLNGIKPDAVEEKWWSDWDESVLQSMLDALRKVQPYYNKKSTPSTQQGEAEELENLREWKRQAMAVMPDFQRIGELIGVRLGDTVHDKIVPFLEKMQKQSKLPQPPIK